MIVAASTKAVGAPTAHLSPAMIPKINLKPQCRYPIHAAIRDSKLSEEAIIQILREAHDKNPASLCQVDSEGRTPIAVAAIAANLAAVMTLLDISRKQMAEGDDVLGVQVSDKLQETAASHNLRILGEDRRFKIHTLLEMASRELTDGFIEQRLPRCTCGKCTDGWFSPKMRFRLRETARATELAMARNMPKFVDGERLDGEHVLSDPALPFLPIAVLERGIHKPFYIGYRAAFRTIFDVLEKSPTGRTEDGLPTVQRLRAEFASGALDGRYDLDAVQFFAERGGSVRYALDYVLHRALWESPTPLGDGSFEKTWEASGTPFGAALSPVVSQTREPPRRRARSNSFKDAFKNLSVRRASLDLRSRSFTPKTELSEAEKEEMRRWRLKAEWDASGTPGCPMDAQFGGVRHLLGLNEDARWEFALADVDTRAKRPSCELRRV